MTSPRPADNPSYSVPPAARGRGATAIGYFIFFSRWLQAPLYIGLIIAQLIYVIVFMFELWHLGAQVIHDVTHPGEHGIEIEEATVMLGVLGLIDVVMIANLLIMVIIGGYETFVSRIDLDGHPDQPEWLSHVNANVLKVKLAMAIIGISSIHLLKTFIEVGDLGAKNSTTAENNVTGETYTSEGVFWQVVIHLTFILSAVALALIDRWSLKHSIPTADGGTISVPGPAPVAGAAVGAATGAALGGPAGAALGGAAGASASSPERPTH
ncbi:TIGR00645 family protein [Schumannella soli]|uniref:TIGR00645 family protein n=1 Tax=Schumannella soli TaxID=2590779 RepID=UPI0015E86224|nr:TIGR00645 family protein [Schumannella soli]